jgi:MOSC domain-containing protein YiiM
VEPIHIVSVNTGVLERLTPTSKSRTGIRKMPVGGAVLCDTLGLVGDAIGNRKHHGGPDQAVYLYSAEDYAWWTDTLGRPCTPGLFGENLTIDQWWDTPRAGDRLHVGEVILELTAPRIPCSTLAAHMGDPRFVDRFARAARPGAYARVVQTGALQAGLTGRVTVGNTSFCSIVELADLWLDPRCERSRLIDALRAPVAIRLREHFLRRAALS